MPGATTLARREIGDVEEAEAFLMADESWPATAFDGIEAVAENVLEAVGSGRKITIYGDYDADGVCATTILVELLTGLGAACDWLIPDRISDGYGLGPELVEGLAARGTNLIVTVDCGVTSVTEVELAKNLGMDIIITDHHQFGEQLPSCPIIHPVLSDYPYPYLCGAGVAAKLASVIRQKAGSDPSGDELDLDLVALATVADMMPLTGENRRLVREGILVARRGARLGMRALMSASGVEPVALSAGDLGFRLGPRVNAVGRMYRADAGVELFLTEDATRAQEIGQELSRANSERKAVEREVETDAEREFRGNHGEDASAIVVAGEGWHQGVVGIVAARLARRHGLPAVVLSISSGVAKGSARSVPGVDLYRAISEVSDLLVTFGGHEAAAGLTLSADRIDDLRSGLDRVVASQTGGGPVVILPSPDAFIGGAEVDLEGAERLERLAPFGKGNRSPTIVIPSARIEDVREMGEGRHSRFSIVSGGHRAAGLAFGRKTFPGGGSAALDLIGELSVNHWRGSAEPRFQVTGVSRRPEDESGGPETAGEEDWWNRFEAALAGTPLIAQQSPQTPESHPDSVRWRGSAESAMAEVISSGARVLVVTADALGRWRELGGSAIGRFMPRSGQHDRDPVDCLWPGSPSERLGSSSPFGEEGVVLTDFETLGLLGSAAGHFEEVVMFDPPASQEEIDRVRAITGRVHLTRDPSSVEFALRAAAERGDPVPQLRVLYREIRDAGRLEGDGLARALRDHAGAQRAPERAASLLAILIEAGVVSTTGTGPGRGLEVVSSKGVDLESSAEFRRLARIHEEQISFIRQSESLEQ